MARGTWADAVRVREGRRALERRRGDPFVRIKKCKSIARASIPVTRNVTNVCDPAVSPKGLRKSAYRTAVETRVYRMYQCTF